MRGFAPPAVVATLLCGVLTLPGVAQEVGLDLQTPNGSGQFHDATIALKSDTSEREQPVAGNPLWALPLRALSGTRARPLFSPSRRPPPDPVIAAPVVARAKPPPPRAAEPDHPPLTLLGTIVGNSEGIGVFIDETSHDVIRLKIGELHGDWTLRSVRGRVADFERGDHLQATLALAPPGAQQTPANLGSDAAVAERAATAGSDRIAAPPSENRVKPAVPALPAATKGTFKRTPREL